MNKLFPVFISIIAVVIYVLIVFVGSLNTKKENLMKEAIERGYAIHCPLNGEWSWINECEAEGK